MALALAVASMGCRDKEEASRERPGAPPTTVRAERASRAYRAGNVAGGHAIDVRVEMATRRPSPMWPIPKMVRAQCATDHVVDEALSASPEGGANGAVVWLDDIHEGRPFTPASAAQDEKGCTFTPHVLALPAEGTLTLSNSDPSNHAVRFDFLGEGVRGFQKTLPAGASVGVTIQGEWAGRVARVTCPIHLWMYGYALFFDHPYFAVTQAGAARLEGVPSGTYHLVVWHEGTTSTYDSSVKLSPPETARVEVVVGGEDVKRSFVIADDGAIAPK